jgi:predicted small secreted protein
VKSIAIVALSVFICLLFASCKKNSATGIGNGSPKLSYGDSVFYVRGQSYEISPNITETGTYTAFPENLLIDKATGKITVAIMGNGKESQTGLRYKIKFQATGSNRVDSTYIVLAGINSVAK